MNKTWMQWAVAAILVILAGVLIASAEEQRIEVRVEKDSDDSVTVDVNGVTETVTIEDLADGESRTFDVGDHELVVKRVGDALTVISDGHAFGHHAEAMSQMIWMSDDGETIEIDGDCEIAKEKLIVMKVDAGADGEADVRTYKIKVDGEDILLDGEHEIDIEEIIASHGHGEHGAIFISKDGDVHHPGVVGLHGMHSDMVKYRCDETGSVLMVAKDDAIEDVYICPATGCVMTKVDEPEVRVIKIKTRVEVDDEE